LFLYLSITFKKGIEIGDIGRKSGYDPIDNGYIKFTHLRIPRNNMLMKFANVSDEGKFEKKGNDHVMYAVMLIMRGVLCMFGSLLLTISTTIAIRYSCVRRQTADLEG
jgi:alkylation response protein AidB-like acyl-CoA dehydrogenase